MSLHRNVKFHAIYDDGKFCGITYYAENDNTVYLTYLAVSEKLRGQGYGSKILTMLEDNFPDKQIVIDIEPVTKKVKITSNVLVGWSSTREMVSIEQTRSWRIQMENLKLWRLVKD